ncbi:MAG TPA: S9 family peptidase [Pyrinomonadaceae bacterium]|jgi:dipeptidyl aminopeptidase/acylaminoacyl peptidase
MLRRIALLVCLSAVACLCALAGEEKRLTVEDALAFVDASAPQWSPDGRWLAFTVSEWNRKEDRRDTHIYLVAADGSAPPFRLTNGERGESQPAWSPDGARLAFLANRDAPAAGATAPTGTRYQIWTINVRGGEAERLTDEEAGVTQFRWSPDAKRIAYVVRDTPKDKAERDRRKKERFDAIVVDSELTYAHLWVIDTATRQKRRVTEGPFSVSDPQWSPDGTQLAYVAGKTGAQESSFTDIAEDRNTDIYVVAAAGGAPRQLTNNPGSDESPRWARDGKLIAYLSSEDPMSWAEKTDLMLVEAAGGAPRNLTGAYEDAVTGAPRWSPDGQALYASGMNGVYGQLLKVAVAGGEPRPVFESRGAYQSVELARDGERLAFTFNDAKGPNNVWTASVTGQGAKQLTFFNPQAKDFELADTEVLRWKAPDGLEIEGLLVKPVGYVAGERYPAILLIHGGPYGQFTYGWNRNAQLYAARGYAVLMPNPRGSTGYGHKFMTANLRDWGGKDYQDLMAGVDEVIKRGVADPERLAVMGGSYGGFMTFWTITQTDRFKCAIGHAGISDWYGFFGQTDVPGLMEYGLGGLPWAARETYAKWSPMSYVDRVKTPLMITHGEQDRRVPIQQAELFYRSLKRRGVEVAFVRYPREGHSITEPNHQIDLLGRQLAWLEKHLQPDADKPAPERPAGRR